MTKKSADKRRPKKKSAPTTVSAIDEQTRIHIHQVLDKFRASHDKVYTFDANLDNHERAAVHLLCRKVGMKSKSTGTGKQRRVSVYKCNKRKSKSGSKAEEEGTILATFSDESRRVLSDLFVRYPPGDDEAVRQSLNKPSENSMSSGRKDDIFRKPVMKKAEIVKRMQSLASRLKSIPKLKEISAKRSKLPIASFQNAITSTISAHQVVLISGETGCGKTTQVPQYLLDYMWANGQACKVVCTQPRRISATSVAERISQERGEDIGDSIGYKIRLETKGGRQTSVMFCTTGVLLKVLVSGGANGSQSESSNHSRKVISEITHIIVDEIHERDHFSDFMLTILRDLLPMYPRLRLVLMSATLDAERFSNYFGGCPVIRVPGFTHPVKSFYLEEVLTILKTPEKNHLNASSNSVIEESNLSEETRVALDEAIETALSNDEYEALLELISSEGMSKMLNYQHSKSGVSPLMVFAGKGRVGDVCTLLSLGAVCHLQARDGSNALNWALREGQTDTVEILKKHMKGSSTSSVEEQKLVEKYMSFINPEIVDVVLVEKLLNKICMESQEGAILVFLPGWEEINRTRERLLANVFFKNSSKFLILTLHSMIPSVDQKKVFIRPPPGCRKIILSTNIAETAITIDDVVYVVDSGRMKEKNYDPYSNVSTLQSSWISQASAKQREGRAGRCQPGVCYHLFTRLRAASFPEFQMPEIKRIPIEELCLQVKMLDRNCKVEEFLKKTLDPPVSETIKNAISILQEIGAFSHDERLTDLGEKLAALPVHPSTSKMLFFAILLNCLDPALTLACASDFRDPFTIPMLPNDKKRADAAKAELASLYGGHSDQLAVIAAFDCWRKAKEKGTEARFCREYFVSSGTMFMLSGMRQQLLSELIRSGFISDDKSNCSMNAQDPGIVRAVVVAGLYPMVGKLHQRRYGGKRLMVETASGDQVCLHPSSVNSKLSFQNPGDRPLLVYDEVIRGDGGLHTRRCTLIGPLTLLLVATEMVVAPGKGNENAGDDDGDNSGSGNNDDMEDDKTNKQGDKIMSSPDNAVTVVVDRWLSFESTALDVAQIYCLRERLSAAILFKISNPSSVLPPVLGASVYATACLLAYDGLNGISSSVESVDTLTTMVNNTEIGKKKSTEPPNLFLMSLFNGPQRNLSSHGNKPTVEAPRRQNHPSQSVPMVVVRPMAPQPRIEASRRENHPATAFRSVPMVVEPPVVPLQTRPTLRAESLTGYSANTFGPYGPRGSSSKRPRGSSSKRSRGK
ncbi:DExH-box ATP-dependent RNA helicase DExH6 [Silene latifolia]|uniref:DExH-box ATP-dependent RNA helicase DExH6 n=1 Tax=Silene latifolia TaxID=37657 RepID=UPI003D76F6F6